MLEILLGGIYMLKFLAALSCFILGSYQLYRTYQMFSHEQKNGGKQTSVFLPIALFSSIIFSLALFGLGISLFLD